jgi:hypothetical protein
LFVRWDPDVMVDTHTSNGADYQHVVTLIATQPDKLGGRCGSLLREAMIPALYADMAARGFPMCPYVNTVREIPDDGIADFLDSPRFSTGYGALHHTIGFTLETHMLKPYDARYRGTLAFVESALAYTVAHGDAVRAARGADRAAASSGAPAALDWALDTKRVGAFRFSGYEAVREPSRLGHYQRLRYDRASPWVKDIPYFDRYETALTVVPPRAYLLPQAWHDVASRLQAHGMPLQRIARDGRVGAEAYRIVRHEKRPEPFEGRHLHGAIEVRVEPIDADVAEGDWLLPLGGPHDRFIVETMEPQGMDSFFRWGFFDSVLNRKESFSDYVFEDEAERLLAAEPGLAERFEAWKKTHPERLADSQAVLRFIYENARRYAEPEWRRYPVLRLMSLSSIGPH